ncbi:hypothetical protein EBR96_00030 [bacterium]|nr:hypothetical protein [bacterium]
MAEVEEYEESLDSDIRPSGSQPGSGGLVSRRRIITIGSIVLVIAAISGLYFMMAPSVNKPMDPAALAEKKKKEALERAKNAKYDVLFAQLTIDQVTDVLRELSRAGISFKSIQSGKNYQVQVEEERLEEAKMLLAAKGIPSGTPQGYQLLDSGQTLGVTEFDKRVRFVRALEGEIEKSIEQIESIENAKVKVVLPEQRLFAVTQPPVTTAILLTPVLGAKLTDDIVFSIIQYTANAVENLQPENVTVVDSKGHNLSDGIFERMAAREAGLLRKGEDEDAAAAPSTRNSIEDVASAENARPIAPNYEEVDQWYQVKQKYEDTLIERATKQLVGILPVGSFKVALTADLGALENGEIVDVKRITTSIVVDNNREDIDLNDDLKRQIFNTVAASIGYVRGRDVIILNRADFSIMSPEEKRRMEAIMSAKKNLKYWLLGAGAILAAGLLTTGVVRIVRRRRSAGPTPELGLAGGEPGREADFEGLQTELDKERRYEQVREVAMTEPEILANIMEEWLSGQPEGVRG